VFIVTVSLVVDTTFPPSVGVLPKYTVSPTDIIEPMSNKNERRTAVISVESTEFTSPRPLADLKLKLTVFSSALKKENQSVSF